MDEADVIAAIADTFRAAGVLGDALADDTAPLPSVGAGHTRIVKADMAVEGRDFLRALTPVDAAGFRAIVQNLSDLAAGGAHPVGFVWSLAIPESWSLADVTTFSHGAARAAATWRCPLVGGDLSRTDGPLVCAVTMWGDVHGARHVRTGARAGDVVWLSRRTGASAAGLRLLQAGARLESAHGAEARALTAHLWPSPEFVVGQALVGIAHACMDVSDGLLLDLWRLAKASGVALHLDGLADAVDIDASATEAEARGGGEDWALVFCAPPEAAVPAGSIRLGVVAPGAGLWERGTPLAPRGYDHFAQTR